jgi:hypothetical protein
VFEGFVFEDDQQDSRTVFAEAITGFGLESPVEASSEAVVVQAEDAVENLRSLFQREVRVRRFVSSDLFVRGYPPSKWNGHERETVDEKVFSVDDLVRLETKEQMISFIGSFSRGMTPIYRRVLMPTGTGKTTRLPWRIAEAIGQRVLLLVPSVGLAHYAAAGIKANGGFATVRIPTRSVTVMVQTYADFVFHMAYNGYKQFKGWQVGAVVIDECHDNSAYAYVVRALIATYFTTCSVLLTSATQLGQNMQTAREGTAVPRYLKDYDIEKICDDPRWDERGEWAQDRTCVFLPNDDFVYSLRDALLARGHKVHILDSASVWADVRSVIEEFKRDSTVARILLALPKFGTGYSLPVLQIIDSCLQSAVTMRDGKIVETFEPITAEEKLQHAGRLGHAAKGKFTQVWMLSDVELNGSTIRPGDRMRAWLLLTICRIRPRRSVFAEHARVFGTGTLSSLVASQYFATVLPIEMWHMLRAEDGLVPKSLYSIVRPYSHATHFIVASDFDDPQGISMWYDQRIGNYYRPEVTDSTFKVKIPGVMPLRYRILFNGIFAIRAEYMTVEVDTFDGFDADTPSDAEEEVMKLRASPRAMVVPATKSVQRTHLAVNTDPGFSYERMAHIDMLRRDMTRRDRPRSVVVVEAHGTRFELSEAMYRLIADSEKWSLGILTAILKLLDNPARQRLFVSSELFDKWSSVWDAFANTVSDPAVLGGLDVQLRNRCADLLSALVRRFDRDVSVAFSVSGAASVVSHGFWESFKRFIRKSEVHAWIRQPKSFVGRVAQVHAALQAAVLALPTAQVHSPTLNQWVSKDVPWSGGSSRLGASGNVLTGHRIREIRETPTSREDI